MSDPQSITPKASPRHHPHGSPLDKFLVPSPIITKRTRTLSQSEKAMAGPTFQGKVKDFCRQKGHGFITPADGSPDLFIHISDIDGEYCPQPGDDVSYKTVLCPPKNEKVQAVHVNITHLAPGTIHEKWDN